MKGIWKSEPLDNIQRGDYLVISGCNREVTNPRFPYDIVEPSFSGRPFLVLEVGLPFISWWDGQSRGSFDLREIQVRKVSKAYALSLFGPADLFPFVGSSPLLPRKVSQRRPRKQKGSCPRCEEGHMRRETFIEKGPEAKDRGWRKLCEECGYVEGTPLTKGKGKR